MRATAFELSVNGSQKPAPLKPKGAAPPCYRRTRLNVGVFSLESGLLHDFLKPSRR
jgi:hypothetical protein